MQSETKTTKLIPTGDYKELVTRKLTADTCRKWGYHCINVSGRPAQVANYRDDLGSTIAQKVRWAGKEFTFLNGHAATETLFGRHLWRDKGRRVIITEGELDAMSVDQAMGGRWPVVSLPNGSSSVKKAITANLEWLNGFEEVVLCFDMDEPGRKAVSEAVKLFPPGKAKIVSLPLKDASDMLQEDKLEELVRALWDAQEYRPDGIVTLADVRYRVLASPEQGMGYFLESLSTATYGRRYGEAVGLGAGTGVGKTTWLTQQIAYDLGVLDLPVAIFAFEQHPAETLKRVAGQMAQRTFHIPKSGWTQEELEASLDVLEGKKLFLYDHFGSCDWGVIKERIRFLNHAHGVRIFYLDHLTALAAMADDERKALEEIMAEIGSLVKELDCWMLFVSHLATPEGTPHEEGGRVTIRHFKGSRAIGFWSHAMIALERDQQAEDQKDTLLLRVLKDRYTGQATGLTIPLGYDKKTGLLFEAKDKLFTEDF